MPSSDLKYATISEKDYLQGEKLADIRHEYTDGQIAAMAGTSKRHNRIAGNIYRALMASGQQDCDVYIGDIKVHIEQRASYYYPDVMVGCDESDNANDYYLEKPCLIIEVLSPSTEKKDATEKLLCYQEIESLQNYMMVDQDNCHISLIYRQRNHRWWVKNFTDKEEVISLSCPKISLKIADIYESIAF